MQKRQTPARMRALLARLGSQNLTMKGLAQESGIPIYTLRYWARKFREEDVARNLPAIVPVSIAETSDSAAIRVELGSGKQLIVDPGFDESHLLRLVEVLDQAC